ncbi:hypothetical protein PAMP_008620 [Pampus punctatissimus]
MDSSWLLVVLAATVFVSIIVLAIVCLDCRNTGPLVSIRQASASEIYMPPHPSDPGTQRRQRSFTPTETGPESFTEDYIIVLPDGEGPLTNQSRASTPSSGTARDTKGHRLSECGAAALSQ